MLLIIFLGLIAKLALVSGDCDVGTQKVKDYNFTRSTGTWYVLSHNPHDIENNLGCVVSDHGLPQGNISVITVQAYNTSEEQNVTFTGIATNWDSTGFEEIYPQSSIWSGRYYIIAIDYDRFIVLKLCSLQTNKTHVYVLYRRQHPDETTVNDVLNELRKNKIDDGKLVDWKADHCQQAI